MSRVPTMFNRTTLLSLVRHNKSLVAREQRLGVRRDGGRRVGRRNEGYGVCNCKGKERERERIA